MNRVKIGAANLFTIDFNELELIDIAQCEDPKETLEAFYLRQEVKPELLLNCGFFSQSSGDPVFSLMDEGDLKAVNLEDRVGVGIIGKTGLVADSLTNLRDKGQVRDFVSAYPMIVQNRVIVKTAIAKDIAGANRRTIIGWDDTHVEVVLVDDPGMTLDEARAFLDSRPVVFAANLDGGGSTRGLYLGNRVTEELWSRPVDNVMAFYLKKKVLYRVQVGAFTHSKYAESMRTNIASLTDKIGAGYAKCYVRRIDQYYKVQVGAFSERGNANRVVSDLATKGIQAFVVASY